jgi:hypothetical protein
MNDKKRLALALLATTLALPAAAGGLPKVSMKEAMKVENAIIAAAPKPAVAPVPAMLYTQPANHTEPCKLPTNQSQLDRRNFRAYWDGQCKDGYAFGLGRDIAISDTHHVEEITVYNLSVPQDFPRTNVIVDFVNHTVGYGTSNQATRSGVGQWQMFVLNADGTLSLTINTGVARNGGGTAGMSTSPFDPTVTLKSSHAGQPTYYYADYTAVPGASDLPASYLAVVDPATNATVGYGVVRYRNGAVQYRGPNGPVRLAQEYQDHLLAKITEANAAIVDANAAVTKAQQLEREYLYAACKSDYVIAGVPAKDIPLTREICTWRDQFKDAYAKSDARWEQKKGELQFAANDRERQLAVQRAQQQQAMQQQAAANAAAWAALNQSTQQTTSLIQQQNQQLMNFTRSLTLPAPAIVQPNTPVVCTQFGRIVKCQ